MTTFFDKLAAYAVSLAKDLDYTITGTCGDNMFWSLDPGGNLEIKGSGTMEWDQNSAPWQRYKKAITKIVVGDGITSIKENAFTECSQATEVKLGKDIKQIGKQAFWMMPELKDITLPQGIEEIGEQAIGFDSNGSHIINEFTIYGYAGTVAETYANDPGAESGETIKFVDISTEEPGSGEGIFAGGSGTEEDPYQVATAEQLNAVRDYPEACFIQTKNISLAQYPSWEPIGTNNGFIDETAKTFTGTYDGQNYSISNLNVKKEFSFEADNTSPDSVFLGLFGYTSDCSLKNITLDDIAIDFDANNFSVSEYNAGVYAGGLIGYFTGSIENCHIKSGKITIDMSGHIPLNLHIGGVIGTLTGGTGRIFHCTNNASINVSTSDIKSNSTSTGKIGGIIGRCGYSSSNYIFSNCVNYAPIVIDSDYVLKCGGIIGELRLDDKIEFCINYGPLHLKSNTNGYRFVDAYGDHAEIGGIVGWARRGNIENCINYGGIDASITSTQFLGYSNTGGILGAAEFSYTEKYIKNCFNLATELFTEEQALLLDPPKTEKGNVARITADDTIYHCKDVYSIATLVNNQSVSEATTSTGKNGQTLSEEEMNKKIQYILEALGLDQTA